MSAGVKNLHARVKTRRGGPALVAQSTRRTAWMMSLAALFAGDRATKAEQPRGPSRAVVYLDAGHGTGDNQGATTAACGREGDLMLELAEGLAAALLATGAFEVILSRTSSSGPTYDARLRAAERARADVLLSLHGDVRRPETAQLVGGCPNNPTDPGFSVLFSEDGPPPIVRARRRMARALARRFAEAGFTAYDGADYAGLFEADEAPGVFRDRRGLFMLRRPRMASVIIETHHVQHPSELARWMRPNTRDAFYRAVLTALSDALAAPRGAVTSQGGRPGPRPP